MNVSSSISRRSFVGTLVTASGLGLVGCAQGGAGTNPSGAASSKGDSSKLIVFAAASLTEALTAIGDLFKASEGGSEVVFTFDSSGTLKKQIVEGAPCDVFVSAAQKQMNQLDAKSEKGNEGIDLVDHDTRVDLLENKVTLCVPKGNPKGVSGFADMADKLKAGQIQLCMGNSDVPVGQYTQQILEHLGLDENELAQAGRITYGSNVKEVTSQLSEAAVDCGVIYKTDAHAAGLEVVEEADSSLCGRVIYPAAALKDAPQPELAKAFLAFLKTADAAAQFEKAGFTPLATA
ncbi:molybdate ABC transporter substrate-binding protein [Olsenella massiliensis]|uniref:molybdate ABC transporter substrate-binding protein n=1 Tax=Olsenella massiliensis TaxID=1622075 RepID=UPI00071DC1D4|nr:molybdate ABC transporter substrate-binding protein [Olsenella massiliensis]